MLQTQEMQFLRLQWGGKRGIFGKNGVLIETEGSLLCFYTQACFSCHR